MTGGNGRDVGGQRTAWRWRLRSMAPQPPQAARPLSTRVRVAAHRLRRVTPRDAWRFAAQWARSSPGTHIWLVILAVTSAVMALAPPDVRSHLLHHFSTNLIELHRHPI